MSSQLRGIYALFHRKSVQRYNNFRILANKFAFFCIFSCVFAKKAVILHPLFPRGWFKTLLGGADTVFLPFRREDAPGAIWF